MLKNLEYEERNNTHQTVSIDIKAGNKGKIVCNIPYNPNKTKSLKFDYKEWDATRKGMSELNKKDRTDVASRTNDGSPQLEMLGIG